MREALIKSIRESGYTVRSVDGYLGIKTGGFIQAREAITSVYEKLEHNHGSMEDLLFLKAITVGGDIWWENFLMEEEEPDTDYLKEARNYLVLSLNQSNDHTRIAYLGSAVEKILNHLQNRR